MDQSIKCPSCGAKLALEPIEEAEAEHQETPSNAPAFRPRKRGRHAKGMNYEMEEKE
jgi:hypothetical protein